MATIISATNFADAAGVTFSVLTGTMSLPLTQLQRPFGDGLARGATSGFPVLIFEVDLGQERDIISLGLLGMNGEGAGVQFALFNGAGGTSPVLPYTLVEWFEAWRMPFSPACWLHATTAPWRARYVRIRIDIYEVSGSLPAFVDMRRLWVGGGALVAGGVSRRWTLDFVDASQVDRAPRGGAYGEQQARWRRARFGLQRQGAETMIGDGALDGAGGVWTELAAAGKAQEIVVAPRAHETSDQLRYWQTLLGVATEWSPLVNDSGEIYGLESAAVEETLMEALS
ncbi:MAG: hypothetical protein U1F26_10910 [Lysobacterales bacterium]